MRQSAGIFRIAHLAAKGGRRCIPVDLCFMLGCQPLASVDRVEEGKVQTARFKRRSDLGLTHLGITE